MSDEVKCPHCGVELEELWDIPGLDQDGASARTECPDCGGPVKISVVITYDYSIEKDDHVHNWKDARNQNVTSGEFCQGCGAIRAGNSASDETGS